MLSKKMTTCANSGSAKMAESASMAPDSAPLGLAGILKLLVAQWLAEGRSIPPLSTLSFRD
jgi:hypothetical protein